MATAGNVQHRSGLPEENWIGMDLIMERWQWERIKVALTMKMKWTLPNDRSVHEERSTDDDQLERNNMSPAKRAVHKASVNPQILHCLCDSKDPLRRVTEPMERNEGTQRRIDRESPLLLSRLKE